MKTKLYKEMHKKCVCQPEERMLLKNGSSEQHLKCQQIGTAFVFIKCVTDRLYEYHYTPKQTDAYYYSSNFWRWLKKKILSVV